MFILQGKQIHSYSTEKAKIGDKCCCHKVGILKKGRDKNLSSADDLHRFWDYPLNIKVLAMEN